MASNGGQASATTSSYRGSEQDVRDSSSGSEEQSAHVTDNSVIGKLASGPTTGERLASQPTSEDLLKQGGGGRSGAEQTADVLSLAGAANTGMNVPLQGVDVGPLKINAMRFGRYTPNSTRPAAGYKISQFSDPGFRGYIAKQTMVSSQAAYEVAKQMDPSLRSTRFEVETPMNGVRRSYDAQVRTASNNSMVEVKAGKTINAAQLKKDIDLAKTGRTVEYVFTGNPITGNHGPDAATTAKLADAAQQSGGNLSHRVAADIAPSGKQVDAVVTASKFSRYARGAGKVLGPAGVALDVYTIGSAYQKDGGTFGKNTKVAVAETAGGWAGAASGGWAGAQLGATAGAVVGGPVGAAVGGVVGGVIGAVGGAISGSWIGNKISSWF